MINMLKGAGLGSVVLMLTACTSTATPGVVKRQDVSKACEAESAVVLDVTEVVIHRNPEAAQTVGAALGGYAANRATKNNSDMIQVLATVAGAGAGAVVADAANNKLMYREGTELILKTQHGTFSVVQETDSDFVFLPGSEVWVVGSPLRGYSASRCANQVRVYPK